MRRHTDTEIEYEAYPEAGLAAAAAAADAFLLEILEASARSTARRGAAAAAR